MVSASAPAPLTLPLEEETPATPTQQTSSSGDDSGADDADGGDYRAADMEVASDADGDADLDQDLDVDEGVGVRGAEGDERDQLDWASAAGALAGSRAGQCPVLTGAAISAAAWNESEDAELYTLIQQFGKHSWGTIYKYGLSTSGYLFNIHRSRIYYLLVHSYRFWSTRYLVHAVLCTRTCSLVQY